MKDGLSCAGSLGCSCTCLSWKSGIVVRAWLSKWHRPSEMQGTYNGGQCLLVLFVFFWGHGGGNVACAAMNDEARRRPSMMLSSVLHDDDLGASCAVWSVWLMMMKQQSVRHFLGCDKECEERGCIVGVPGRRRRIKTRAVADPTCSFLIGNGIIHPLTGLPYRATTSSKVPLTGTETRQQDLILDLSRMELPYSFPLSSLVSVCDTCPNIQNAGQESNHTR